MEFVPNLRIGTNSGRVAIYHEGEWGTICSHGLTKPVTNLMCERFGFSHSGIKTCEYYSRFMFPGYAQGHNYAVLLYRY